MMQPSSNDEARARSELLTGKRATSAVEEARSPPPQEGTAAASSVPGEASVGEGFEAWKSAAVKRAAVQSIRVSDSELISTGMMSKSYVVYTVQLSRPVDLGGDISVKRRYSEFEALWKSFRRRYSGLFLPPLPPKDGLSSITPTPEFKKKRQELLTLACQAVLQNIFLAHDSLWVAFLSGTGYTIDEDSDRRQSVVGHGPNENKGETRWQQLLATLEPMASGEIQQHVDQLFAECKVLEKTFGRLAKTLTALAYNQQSQVNQLTAFESACSSWADAEKSADASLKDTSSWPEAETMLGATPPPHHQPEAFSSLLLPVVQGWRMSAEQMAHIMLHVAAAAFDYCTLQTVEIKNSLGVVEDKKKALEKARAALYKATNKKPSGRSDVLHEELQREVENLQKVVNDAETQWAIIAQVVVSISIPCYVLERTRALRSATGSFTVGAGLLGDSIATNAKHFFKAINTSDDMPDVAEQLWNYSSTTVAVDQRLQDLGFAQLMFFKPLQEVPPPREHDAAEAPTSPPAKPARRSTLPKEQGDGHTAAESKGEEPEQGEDKEGSNQAVGSADAILKGGDETEAPAPSATAGADEAEGE